MLSSLVKEGHDDGDAPCLSGRGRDDTLEILKMIVGRHMILKTSEAICKAEVCDVNEHEKIVSAYGFVDYALCLA